MDCAARAIGAHDQWQIMPTSSGLRPAHFALSSLRADLPLATAQASSGVSLKATQSMCK